MTRLPPYSPERRLLAALFLAAALLAPASAGAQPQTAGSAEVRAKARAVLANPRFQRELPEHPEPRDIQFSGAGFDPPLPPVSLPVLGAGAFLAQTVFLVLLVVVAVLLAVWLSGKVPWRRSGEQAGVAREGEAAVTPDREPAFEDASRLAAQGLYAEAIHALLLAAIRHFAERSRTPVQASRTSRELVRLLPLGAETRDAFTELVRDVELSLFGGVPVGPEEYERSLSRFRLLTRSRRLA